jgi:chromosome segregation ATPase
MTALMTALMTMTRPTAIRPLFTLLMLTVLAACATTPVDFSVFDNARSAIEQAEAAGAEAYAPLELRDARQRLEIGEQQLADRNTRGARHLADEAEIDAQLALARTRAAIARAELSRAQRDLEALEIDLIDAFGEEVRQP